MREERKGIPKLSKRILGLKARMGSSISIGIVFWRIVLGSVVSAQPLSTDQTILDIIDPNAINTSLTFDKRYPKVEGNPYLYADWVKGEVKSPAGKVWKDMELNYDLYTQELLAKFDDKTVLLSPKAIGSFSCVDPLEVTLNFEKNTSIAPKGYVHPVYQGTYSLWKQFSVRLNTIENNSGGYGQGGNAKEVQRFERADTWYLLRPDSQKPEIFKPSRKELFRLFPQRSNELKKFIKSSRLSLKNDQDWVQIMQYLEGH
ncbi:MAG: hypothetical protein AAF694_13150 [Bacteroidota bacterium]